MKQRIEILHTQKEREGEKNGKGKKIIGHSKLKL